MGLFGGGNSRNTTVNNQDENILNNTGNGLILNVSDIDLDGGNIGTTEARNAGVATGGAGDGGGSLNSGLSINYTQTDFGAVQGALGVAAQSIDSVARYSSEASSMATQSVDKAAEILAKSQPALESSNNLLKLIAFAMGLGGLVLIVKRGR